MSHHPLTLDDQLCFAVYSAGIAINRAYRPLLDELGITYPQYLVLLALWEQDGQTIGAIADRLGLESSTITPLVKRLEVGGLLSRERNPLDERQVIVRLTGEGWAMRERSVCLGERLLEKSGMTIAGLQRLNADVKALRDAMAE
ncbi:MarR family winged helix-turn-helix transcriptional regulator [Sphingomonas oryzagri]|jgi:DNA-binding MarR family transcriptional regulator|uniref:MarR family transcriptional regulator n=1 Tax=Sphingomonas oryzagri TaxID=3042314 RepID=A0ABT6MWI3_9SPHN|nr:MarR family transcriptional regulator [Sphingomonas oryzagri]MDH7637106.1 MarR family transcriptional regulator [Sphingomonas oryzagri]